jgi:redox-sensitive bicupin YhaK (pirin superfamily)
VQWLTAGAGIVHSEMFPLLETERPNRLELFQIWVNLPAKSKFADPYFTMFWEKDVPRVRETDADGRHIEITVIAGALGAARAPAPPPDSWAANPDADLAIWQIRLADGAAWTLPPARDARVGRTLYFFAGAKLDVAGKVTAQHAAIEVVADQPLRIAAVDGPAEILLLQGRPIAEPVAQYGPFVMNTRSELEQAFADYRRTQFGGWPFSENEPVHPRQRGRFARHADGRVEDAPT